MAFFARRGDFKISKMVALSLWVSVTVKFLCKHDYVDGERCAICLTPPASRLIINLTYDEGLVDAHVGHFLVDLRYPSQLLHHFVYSAVGDEPS